MILNCLPYGAADYTLLQAIDTGNGTSQINIILSSFTGYKHLDIIIDSVETLDTPKLRFNSDATSVYTYGTIGGTHSGNTDSIPLGSTYANYFSGMIRLFNFSSPGNASGIRRAVWWYTGTENAASPAHSGFGFYNNTSSATITSVQLISNFSSNAKIRVYGVK